MGLLRLWKCVEKWCGGADGHLRAACPSSRSSALTAKDHPAELIAEALGFLWVRSIAETLGQFEKLLLFALFGFDAVLDEFDQHAVGAKPASLCQAADFGCGGRREADALAYGLVCRAHDTIMHHNGADFQMSGLSQAFGEEGRMSERRNAKTSKSARFTRTVKGMRHPAAVGKSIFATRLFFVTRRSPQKLGLFHYESLGILLEGFQRLP
jgi:hypothetical protein